MPLIGTKGNVESPLAPLYDKLNKLKELFHRLVVTERLERTLTHHRYLLFQSFD
jgi:hypothetical protein